MDSRKKQMKWLLGAFCAVLAADQISKAIIVAYLEPGTPFQDHTFFYFVHQRNSGLIGGMFRGFPVVPFFAHIVATGILVFLFRRLDPDSRWQSLGYGLVLGGALGNLIDRIRLHAVTDFLQVHFYFIPFDFPWKFYPAFNIADSAILTGVTILVFAWNAGKPDDVPSPA